MRIILPLIICSLIFILASPFSLGQDIRPHPRPFDIYSHINCKEEVARIDNYAEQLKKEPTTFAIIAIYAGRNDTKRGEVMARLYGIRDYLLRKHRVAAERITLINGGFRERLTVELWMTPIKVGKEDMPFSTLRPEEVSFKNGRVDKWMYDCVK